MLDTKQLANAIHLVVFWRMMQKSYLNVTLTYAIAESPQENFKSVQSMSLLQNFIKVNF